MARRGRTPAPVPQPWRPRRTIFNSRLIFLEFITAFPRLPSPNRVEPRLWSGRDIAIAAALMPAAILMASLLPGIDGAAQTAIKTASMLAIAAALAALAARRGAGFANFGFTRPADLYPAVTVVVNFTLAFGAWVLVLKALLAAMGIADPDDGIGIEVEREGIRRSAGDSMSTPFFSGESSRLIFLEFITAFPRLPSPDRVKPRLWSGRELAFAVALAHMAIFAPSVILAPVAALLSGIEGAAQTAIKTASVLALAAVLSAFAARRGTGFADFGFTRPRPVDLHPAVTVCIHYMLALVAWASILAALQTVTGMAVLDGDRNIDAGSEGILLIALNGARVTTATPIVEEMLFRGLLFRGLRGYWTFWPAALTSGVWFGVLHFNPLVLPVFIALGVLFAWAYERSRSLWTPILAHGCLNAVIFADNVW